MHFTYNALHKQCLSDTHFPYLFFPPQKNEHHSVGKIFPSCLQHFLETILYFSFKSCFKYCVSLNYFTFHHTQR